MREYKIMSASGMILHYNDCYDEDYIMNSEDYINPFSKINKHAYNNLKRVFKLLVLKKLIIKNGNNITTIIYRIRNHLYKNKL